MLKAIQETTNFIKKKTNFLPEVGIILGTGLGGLVNEINVKHSLLYIIFIMQLISSTSTE